MLDVTCAQCGTVTPVAESEVVKRGAIRVFYDSELGREREEVLLGLLFTCPACGEITETTTGTLERDV